MLPRPVLLQTIQMPASCSKHHQRTCTFKTQLIKGRFSSVLLCYLVLKYQITSLGCYRPFDDFVMCNRNKQQPRLSWFSELPADTTCIVKVYKLNRLPGVCVVCVSLLLLCLLSCKSLPKRICCHVASLKKGCGVCSLGGKHWNVINCIALRHIC